MYFQYFFLRIFESLSVYSFTTFILPVFLRISSKSDTEIKKPGPPPIKPKPVRPKWKVKETREHKYHPVTFEPIGDTTVKAKVEIPVSKPFTEELETKKSHLDYTVAKPKPWKPETKPEGDWKTRFETEVQKIKTETSKTQPQRIQKAKPKVTQKVIKAVQVKGQEPEEEEYIITYEVPEESTLRETRVTKRAEETVYRKSTKYETKMVIVSGTSDESDTGYFKKAVSIKKLPPPTPEKLVIEGDLFPEKPRKYKRVRVRKHKSKTVKYKPVPYVSKPTTYWVPDRKDVLMAAEAWAR